MPPGDRHLDLYVSEQKHRELVWLPDAARSGGVHIVAGRGSGKSLLLGRFFAYLDGFRGIPVVFLDNVGGGIDNCIFMIDSLPEPYRTQMLDRVIYVDMAGHFGSVVPFPFYVKRDNESWYAISQRLLAVIRKIDPELAQAPIAGWNAVYRIGTYTGMLLSYLGLQITEAEDLISNPKRWEPMLQTVLNSQPELAPAVAFFTPGLVKADVTNRGFRTETFLNKISMFSLDPTKRAQVGAGKPGIIWKDVIEKRRVILLDFRHIEELEWQRFLTLWVYLGLADYMRSRPNRAEPPVSFIVDELSYLVSMPSITEDLAELINVISRNHNIWLTLAHQEAHQFDRRTNHVLNTLGTQIYGSTTDPEAAKEIARRFFHYDPALVKKEEPMYMNTGRNRPEIIDYRSVEYTAQEQELRNSYSFLQLPRFTFLVASATQEGTPGQRLQRMSIERLIGGRFADTQKVAVLREGLAKRSGRPVAAILSEIAQRRERILGQRFGGHSTDDAPGDEDTPPIQRSR